MSLSSQINAVYKGHSETYFAWNLHNYFTWNNVFHVLKYIDMILNIYRIPEMVLSRNIPE